MNIASSELGLGLELEQIAHSISEGGQDKPVLAPLVRQFRPGRFHVVGGPSGAGKTTLLSILSLTVRARSGAIRWRGEELTGLSGVAQAAWRRANLGLIFQTSRLVSVMSVSEHISLCAALRHRPAASATGFSLIDKLGLSDKLDSLPAQLSGGEKQRLAIAQALCFAPPLLLADEPTAALDQTNAALVAETLRDYARDQQAVVICVSHDRTVIDAADDVLMLERP